MSFKIFGRTYRIRRYSPAHYAIEIGMPLLLLLGTCLAVIIWAAVMPA